MAKFVRPRGRRAWPAEAGLDEREAGLHEDHQDGADDDPQQVDVLAEHDDWVGILMGERDPGTSTARAVAPPAAQMSRSARLRTRSSKEIGKWFTTSSGAIAARIASAT